MNISAVESTTSQGWHRFRRLEEVIRNNTETFPDIVLSDGRWTEGKQTAVISMGSFGELCTALSDIVVWVYDERWEMCLQNDMIMLITFYDFMHIQYQLIFQSSSSKCNALCVYPVCLY